MLSYVVIHTVRNSSLKCVNFGIEKVEIIDNFTITLIDYFVLNFQFGNSKAKSHFFRFYDSNGDGFIDFEEYLMTLYLTQDGTRDQKLRRVKKIIQNQCTTETEISAEISVKIGRNSSAEISVNPPKRRNGPKTSIWRIFAIFSFHFLKIFCQK